MQFYEMQIFLLRYFAQNLFSEESVLVLKAEVNKQITYSVDMVDIATIGFIKFASSFCLGSFKQKQKTTNKQTNKQKTP